MGTLLQDLRYGFRMLARSPGFTAVAVLTLALGIGANTAVFSLLDQAMLRLLPVYKPYELVILRSPGPKNGHSWSDTEDAQSFSFPMYKALRDDNQVLAGLLARYVTPVSVAFRGETEQASAELVSGNYFQTLGVRPALGRVFSQDDDRVPGSHPVVVLSYGYWARRFGADPTVLNQSILVNARPMTVVGVARRGFTTVQPGQTPDLFLPLMMKAQATPNWDGLNDWNDYWLALIGRLKPGMSRQQAEVGINVAYRSLLKEEDAAAHVGHPSDERFLNKKMFLLPGGRGRTVLEHDRGTTIDVIFGMAILALLIACTNVAGLFLARCAARQHEFAIRAAIGASRWRMARQLITEIGLCAAAGGALSLLVASWTMGALVSSLDAEGLSTALDTRVLAWELALTLISAVLFGLTPSLRAAHADVTLALKEQGTSASAGVSQARFRKSLLAFQAAFTVLLLTGAGLFSRSLWNLRHIELGMRPDHLIEFSIAPALSGYSPQRASALADRLCQSLAALPAVQAASAAEIATLTNTDEWSNTTVPGAESLPNDETEVSLNFVGPGYFSTLGIPLLTGREFTASDNAQTHKVAVVNEAMVRRFYRGRDPIGARFAFGAGTVQPDVEIVGVVKDAKYSTLRESTTAFVYRPYAQDPKLGRRITFYVRTFGDPRLMAESLRKAAHELDANLPVFGLKTVDAVIDENLSAERLVAKLAGCFAVIAALLAALGIYGVLAYMVVQRTREIGIRMALGARPRQVRWLIIGEVAPVLVVGIGMGLPLGYAVARLAESLLYGVRAGDLPVYLAGTMLIVVVAALASYVPARRATKVDPMVALRYE
jgi:putative ABC transport system permease protein